MGGGAQVNPVRGSIRALVAARRVAVDVPQEPAPTAAARPRRVLQDTADHVAVFGEAWMPDLACGLAVGEPAGNQGMERPYQIWPLSRQPGRLVGVFEELRLPGGPFLGRIDEP